MANGVIVVNNTRDSKAAGLLSDVMAYKAEDSYGPQELEKSPSKTRAICEPNGKNPLAPSWG